MTVPPSVSLRLRRWLKPPRRLRFHRTGWVFSGGSVVLGVAAIVTGNNLLFLLLGAMLGFITVSGTLSELMLRRLRVQRRPPRGATAGIPARLVYEIENRKPRLPSFAVDVGEAGASRAFVAALLPGATGTAGVDMVWPRRGVYPLDRLVLGTSFPFGLFRKEMDVSLPGEVVVWPRTDGAVREPRVPAERSRRGEVPAGAAGARGEYRGLRDYRVGDDPRDVHWRSTARTGAPVVREYERDEAEALWLCLDLRAPEDDRAEAAVEIAASLAARATRRGQPLGLVAGGTRVDPGTGPGQLARVLEVLARARFRPDAPASVPPRPARECVGVASNPGSAGWGDLLTPEEA